MFRRPGKTGDRRQEKERGVGCGILAGKKKKSTNVRKGRALTSHKIKRGKVDPGKKAISSVTRRRNKLPGSPWHKAGKRRTDVSKPKKKGRGKDLASMP